MTAGASLRAMAYPMPARRLTPVTTQGLTKQHHFAISIDSVLSEECLVFTVWGS